MKTPFRPRSGSGFSLVEVILALGIASFCLVPLLGLIPLGLKDHQAANEQTRLVHLAGLVVQDLQSTAGGGAATSPRFQFSIPATSTPGSPTVESLYFDASGAPVGAVNGRPDASSNPLYCVTLSFLAPAAAAPDPASRAATMVRVMVTWPAQAGMNPGSLPIRYTGLFQTVVALDRN